MIRFWNNRFIRDNEEIIYLRNLVEKERLENKRLVSEILQFVSPKEVKEETEPDLRELKPVFKSLHWKARASELEKKSREARKQMDAEREVKQNLEVRASSPIKTTEELEFELGLQEKNQ